MSKVIQIKRGLDIKLKGEAEKISVKADRSQFYGLKPTDFSGLTPKLTVKEGDEVKAGSPLFFDKKNPDILFTSPVSGKVSLVNRGERRKILEVVVEAAETDEYVSFEKADPLSLTREDVIKNIMKSGLWPSIKQRPYDIIANPEEMPKAIFISAFDSSPLSPDYDFVMQDQEHVFQTGINALTRLTEGKIHVNINKDYPSAKAFTEAKNVQVNYFHGPHPSGNVGVQIHHIDPINKGEVVWVLKPQDVAAIGRLFETGTYDASKIIALAGSEVKNPKYYKILNGASITQIIKDNINEGKVRYISGNPLTGSKIINEGFIGYYDSQLSVIPEGDYYEFFGWALPGLGKFSFSKAFISWLTPNKEYALDTNYHGAERAFVMTGEYEKVLPMDVYPMQLLKAILVEDIDLMEKLGIYEVAEEDFALCEFICTSKIEIQSIIRKGLDLMIKEMN